jgi:hypothetical protein
MDINTLTRLMCELGIPRNPATVAAMIRFIQQTEGYEQCFSTGRRTCPHVACSWRSICLREETAHETTQERRPLAAKARCAGLDGHSPAGGSWRGIFGTAPGAAGTAGMT